VPGQEVVPQVERYTGSDVLGMEYTTARPMGWETGANPPLPMPGDRCPGDLCHYATVKGKKVMR
jgi:hypothetical protein